MEVFQLFVFLFLGILLFAQDYKSRSVNVIILILYLLLINTDNYLRNGIYQVITNLIFTLFYILICLAFCLFYFRIKNIEFLGERRNLIGLGDILLIIGLGIATEPIKFLYFTTVVFAISILTYKLFKQKNNIPLAGNMAFAFSFMILLERLSFTNLT